MSSSNGPAATAPSPPPASPLSEIYEDQPVVATDEFGMIANGGEDTDIPVRRKSTRRRRQQDVKVVRKKREPRQYVSKHFTQAKPVTRNRKTRAAAERAVKEESSLEDDTQERGESTLSPSPDTNGTQIRAEDEIEEEQEQKQEQVLDSAQPVPLADSSPQQEEETDTKPQPRIFYGVDIDAWSSDSELSSAPSDIGPDPFTSPSPAPKKKRKKHLLQSPFFPHPHTHSPRSHFIHTTTLPFPPLTHTRFGLMQERLAHDPYRLLLATIFLNKTPGSRAMPIFFALMDRYPTPTALAGAPQPAVTAIIRTLGFQNQRAAKCIALARGWVDRPPDPRRRYRKLNYPTKGDGRDVGPDEVLGPQEDDHRVAWEISHLPGLGPYSHDSWRMFCRDEVRGLARDWLGEGAQKEFEPEWKRVLPTDKELRAWMTWMWLKEGWVWNKETGERTRASDELLEMARHGGVVQEEQDQAHLTVKGAAQETFEDKAAVEKPAGDFMPG